MNPSHCCRAAHATPSTGVTTVGHGLLVVVLACSIPLGSGCASSPGRSAGVGAPTRNLLINSSMEQWHSSGIACLGWGFWTEPALRHTFRVSPDHLVKRDGRTSVRLTVTGEYVNGFSGCSAEADKTYAFSIWVRPRQESRVQIFISVQGTSVAKAQSGNQGKRTFDLEPNRWTRIHTALRMPPRTERVTTYVSFRTAGAYNLDQGMLNEDALIAYEPGAVIEPVAPLNRPVKEGEIRLTPTVWDDGNDVVDQPEAAFAFDLDAMSYHRASLPSIQAPLRLGARFERPANVRGISFLLREPGIPDSLTCTLMGKSQGVWRDLDARAVPVGNMTLLQCPHTRLDAIRVDFLPKSDEPVPAPLVYHMQIAQ